MQLCFLEKKRVSINKILAILKQDNVTTVRSTILNIVFHRFHVIRQLATAFVDETRVR